MSDNIKPIQLKRAQIRRGVEGIDTTVKSSAGPARAFAPTWNMVMGYKRGEIDEEEYTRLYNAILLCVPRETWRWLHTQGEGAGEATVLCYCADGKFCHTLVLIAYAAQHYPEWFMEATCEV